MRTIILSIVIIMLSFYQTAQAQQADILSIRQQRIVAIAATTAQGDLENLKTSLARGLDGGMTVNETKEVMVHAYAYCGFPRSLRGLQPPPMQVLDERKARGIADTVGRDAQARLRQPRQAHPRAELLEKLSGAPADAPKTGYAAFAPPIVDRYLKEHLFCDIFERDLLTWQERELAAVAILTALGEGAPADAAVALRHLPAPGAHGRPAPPDDGNRKRAEKRRPPCTRHADARQSELHGGGRGVVARLCRRAGWFRLHGVAGVTFAPGAVTVGTAMREGSSCCAPPAGATTRRQASRYDCCSRGDVVKIL